MKGYKGFLGVVVALLLAGCGGSVGVDENKSMDQVAADAAKMGKADLQVMVDQYESAVAEKVSELDALKVQVKEIPLSELMGEKAKTMKAELGDITTSLGKLKDQMAVYAKELSSAAE